MAATRDLALKPMMDLSDVKVHTGSNASSASAAVGAQAFTAGRDVHFGAGQAGAASPAGQHLLAHEATHVVQQRAGVDAINAAVGNYGR